MRNYEIIFIVRPEITDEEVDKLIAQMDAVVTNTGGKIEKAEKLGRRRLAYRVKRQREGLYILFRFQGAGNTVKEFERRLKVTDVVIKYLTVRIDEDLERAEKFKAIRGKQESKKRRSKPAASPAPAPQPPPAAEAPQA
jgi:small subunit ribosomal protein S6